MGDPAAGKDLYAASCQACHGVFGVGSSVGSKLDPAKKTIDGMSLADYIMVNMPPEAETPPTQQESEDMAAFIGTLPSSDRGKALYASDQFGCAGCHGATGQGGIKLSKAALAKKARSKTVALLATYIQASMPPAEEGLDVCDKACSEDIAKYIWTTFP